LNLNAPQGLPAKGTLHSLTIATASGDEFAYEVTAGERYQAECTYSSSC